MTEGGILPALVGTVVLTFGTALAAMPLGIGAAIYLAEYARDNRLTRAVRLAIVNLAGIPSIVYGLFGLGLFVLFLHLGTSIVAGSLTLGLMTLPVVISHRRGSHPGGAAGVPGDELESRRHPLADDPPSGAAARAAGDPHRRHSRT